ncbi:unnamed protein product [Polarella glacialis]|uniref:Uncharacterized protein n=1 Tax=Polarella glacialis TaxID=89957 RepID=A0A813GEP9_POLGL|nr:unnamed protein product [Polarella glacialis]
MAAKALLLPQTSTDLHNALCQKWSEESPPQAASPQVRTLPSIVIAAKASLLPQTCTMPSVRSGATAEESPRPIGTAPSNYTAIRFDGHKRKVTCTSLDNALCQKWSNR